MTAFERISTTEQVLRALREEIVAGNIAQGEQLREAHIAELLGIGRSAVREALRQLIQEGLVNYEIHRGAFVKVVSIDDVLDIYFAREAIETAAIRRINHMEAPPDFEPLRSCVAEFRAAASGNRKSLDALIETDIRLHSLIVDLSGSPRLSRMFQTLAAEMRMYLHHNHPPYPSRLYVEEHEHLVAAIERRDVAAPELIREHLRSARNLLIERLEDRSSGVSGSS